MNSVESLEENAKRTRNVQRNETNHSVKIQFVCLILFIILFVATFSALIAIIFIIGLPNCKLFFYFIIIKTKNGRMNYFKLKLIY
jgi:ABC-type transport system involved in cytochrome bd biosynthesis fused ATPase/permease subunit